MDTLPYQAHIAERMNIDTETPISSNAVFYQTENGYWIAWHDDIAAVLPPYLTDNEPCDWVEGADSLVELVSLIESGDYEQLLEQEDDAHEHHGCGCGCQH